MPLGAAGSRGCARRLAWLSWGPRLRPGAASRAAAAHSFVGRSTSLGWVGPSAPRRGLGLAGRAAPLRILPSSFIQHGQIVEGHGHVRVIRPQGFLLDRQGAPVEALGLGLITPGVRERRQVVAGDGQLVVVRAVYALEDGERPPVQGRSASSYLPCPSRMAAKAATSAATSG